MDFYSSAVIDVKDKAYRFSVYVPTTIYDPKRAVVEVHTYNQHKIIDKEYFKIKNMPKWNRSQQTISISRKDSKTLETVTNNLIKKIPEYEALPREEQEKRHQYMKIGELRKRNTVFTI